MDRTVRASLLLAAALGACSSRTDPPPGLGKRVFSGPVRALSASPDGTWLAFLSGCADVKAPFLPPQTARCDLRLVPSAGGEERKIASGVTTLPHGFGWAPSGLVLAALADYDHAAAAGTLVVSRGGAPPERIADGVTFHGFDGDGDGDVGAVARGRLVISGPGEPPEPLPGVEGIASFDVHPAAAALAPGGVAVLARQSSAAGGALIGLGRAEGGGAGGRVRTTRIAERAGDYAFAPAGDAFAYTVQAGDGYELRLSVRGDAVPLGRRVHAFAFSPDGSAIAFVADTEPGKQGDLAVAAVPRPAATASRGPAGTMLGREVGEFRWARQAPRLAWLERYDPRVRSGTLGAGGPGMAPRTLASNVSEFDLSPDGAHVAFLQHTTQGGYSVDLGLARLDGAPGEKPRTIARGVFGFSFSPDGRWLYYRTRCVRNAEACDLERVPAGGLAEGARPEAIAPGVKSFEFDSRDPGRLLVTWQRMDMVALDVGVWRDGRLTSVDTHALPGSARFLGPDSRRVAYAVIHPRRQGIYVAELPP